MKNVLKLTAIFSLLATSAFATPTPPLNQTQHHIPVKKIKEHRDVLSTKEKQPQPMDGTSQPQPQPIGGDTTKPKPQPIGGDTVKPKPQPIGGDTTKPKPQPKPQVGEPKPEGVLFPIIEKKASH